MRGLIWSVLFFVVLLVLGIVTSGVAAAGIAYALWVAVLGAVIFGPRYLVSKISHRPVGLGEGLAWSMGAFLLVVAIVTVLDSVGILILDSAEKEYRQACALRGGSNRGCQKEYYKHSDVIRGYDEKLSAEPQNARHYRDRGNEWLDMRNYDRAIADYNEALRIDPEHANTYYNRALAWDGKGTYDRAIADYGDALRLDPRDMSACNAAAWLLATAPAETLRNGARAVELATRAAESTQWANASYLDTLAAAHAETGNFEEAVRWEEKALADAQFSAKFGEIARRRLDLYRKKQPFRIDAPSGTP